MSLTAQIGSSDSSFKLSQKLVASLAERFNFKFEDGWATVSKNSVDKVQKRLKRARREANPVSQVKHPRTAFSFFTQQQRPIETVNHKNDNNGKGATFGELSRFVSEAWKALSPAQLQTYKDMEVNDKVRYQTERAAAIAVSPAPVVVDTSSTSNDVVESATSEAKPKKERKAKATTTAAATTVADATPAVAKPAKASKSSSTVAPAATSAVAPVKAEKAPKAPKAPKSVASAPAPVSASASASASTSAPASASAPAPVSAPASASASAPASAKSASAKAPKAKAAGKA
jgi:hypothetical protein